MELKVMTTRRGGEHFILLLGQSCVESSKTGCFRILILWVVIQYSGFLQVWHLPLRHNLSSIHEVNTKANGSLYIYFLHLIIQIDSFKTHQNVKFFKSLTHFTIEKFGLIAALEERSAGQHHLGTRNIHSKFLISVIMISTWENILLQIKCWLD